MRCAFRECVCVSIVISLACSASYASWPSQKTDPIERLLNNYYKQISTLHALYAFSPMGGPASHEILTLDLKDDYFNVIHLHPAQLTGGLYYSVSQWITNGSNTWVGDLDIPPQKSPGAWEMRCYANGANIPRERNIQAEYGIHLIYAALIPYHVRFVEPLLPSMPSGADTKEMDWTDARTLHHIREYLVLYNGQTEGKIVYEMDLSDGVRIYRTIVSGRVNGRMINIYTLNASHFHKVSGVWIPYLIVQTRVGADGKPLKSSRLQLERIQINVPVSQDTFVFNPTNGTVVCNGTDGPCTMVEYGSREIQK